MDFLILLYNWKLVIHIVPVDLDAINSLKADQWMNECISNQIQPVIIGENINLNLDI